MKQIIQNLGNGETDLVKVPVPQIKQGSVLISSRASLVSIGTERMLVDFGRSSLIGKARQQPDKIKMVLEKMRTDGIAATIDSVRAKLDQPIPLGYCNAGVVLEVGRGNNLGLCVGDRVLSNGPHAEIVVAPKHLCARIPDEVTFEEASFTVLGGIALQGIRLLNPTIGETVVVTGLGLIGLLAVQILIANGCRVLGIDFDPEKCALARQFGAETVDLSKGEDPIAAGLAFSKGTGVDGVLITASTQSNDPVHQAAVMSRKRGRIVLVGVVGLQLSRADFYEKELSFQVSCSYGPGRYDEAYEVEGHDYPFGFVRWTEQRNFQAVLELLRTRKINVRPLISHRFPFSEALKAYSDDHLRKSLGIILEYRSENPEEIRLDRRVTLPAPPSRPLQHVVVGLIGAGNFTGQVLLPALAKTGARLKTIASAAGVTGTHLGRKFAFEESTTDSDEILADSEINTLVVTTRHSSHAKYVLSGLQAGKRVFLEKPLCITQDELSRIEQCYGALTEKAARDGSSPPFVLVGFNRRFAPHIQRMKGLIGTNKEPKSVIITVNAGHIPPTHWTQKTSEGGRIIGEGCHFIDLARFLVGCPIAGVEGQYLGASSSGSSPDTLLIHLAFTDGSVGSIHYLSNGHKSFPKERVEVFCGGRILQLDNFRVLKGFGWSNFSKMKLWRQDKGHQAEISAFVQSVKEGISPIHFSEIVEVMRFTLEVAQNPA